MDLIEIKYGTRDTHIDVSAICYSRLMKKNIVRIPRGDGPRASLFTDPVPGIHKTVFILVKSNQTMFEYEESKEVFIDMNRLTIITDTIPAYVREVYPDMDSKLIQIHKQLKMKHGSLADEYPEQMMAAHYLTGLEKVLEIGGNIGRNSMVIAHILESAGNTNYVVMESDVQVIDKLKENRDVNGFKFHIEAAALSNRPLIQKFWNTIVSDIVLPGYSKVNTITFAELMEKYGIEFDTLVLDCEGAFYYILMDMPEIISNVRLIIMENDYNDAPHKNYIDGVLRENGFVVDYSEPGGWGYCANNFYEVWIKR